MLVFDAHLDLSLNALEYNRDLRQPIEEVRRLEAGKLDLAGRGRGTVCFPEMRKAGIGLCVATQLAGCMKPPAPCGAWESPEQAWAMTQGQLAWYRAMEQEGQLRQISNLEQLEEHLEAWPADTDCPIGYILSLEGADSIRSLDDLERSVQDGLRALGPAHYGKGRWALGHDQTGGLSERGRLLLQRMEELDLILDATHLSEDSFWQALDKFHGPVWASHHNCRALVDDPRQLSDPQIHALAERGAVIGVACDVWMVAPNWRRGESLPNEVEGASLSGLADHVDHICQLLGNCEHVGIGSDLDGGYGTEQTPRDLNTIADLGRLFEILRQRGYSEWDLTRIAHGNFVEFLRRSWS